MGFHDAPGDAEAEAGALAGAGRAGGLAAERHVEDPRQLVGGDPAAGVRHADQGHPLIAVAYHLDRLVRRRVPDRVDHQVAQRPADLGGVHVYRQAAGRRAAQQHALGPGQRLGTGQGLADQVIEADAAAGQSQRARVDARQLKQVIDHDGEPVGFAPDLAVVAAHGLTVGHHLVLQRLGHRPQARQRGPQIVADPGDQLAAAGLQRPFAVARFGQPGSARFPAPATAPPARPGAPGPAAGTGRRPPPAGPTPAAGGCRWTRAGRRSPRRRNPLSRRSGPPPSPRRGRRGR